VIDTREQKPYSFSNCETITGTLATGDYSIKGYEHEFSIERKSLSDWASSITQGRERLEREIIRAKKNLKFFAFVIETDLRGIWRTKLYSQVSRTALANTAIHWSVKYNIPIIFVSNRTQGARKIMELSKAWIKYQTNQKYKDIKELVYG